MRNFRRYLPPLSIRTRIIALLLAIVILGVAATALMAVSAAQNAGNQAQHIGREMLRQQAESSLEQLNQYSARENDQFMESIGRDAQQFASQTASLYQNPKALSGDKYPSLVDHLQPGPDGIYKNSAQDFSSLYVPNTTPLDEQTMADVRFSAYLNLLFEPAFLNNPRIKAIYFGTPRDVVRYYPNIDLGSVVPSNFAASQRIWYTGSVAQRAAPGKAWWSPAYLDATGLGVITTAAVPVYSRAGKLLGVVGFDITLTEMKSTIEASQFLPGGYSFLTSADGHAIAMPEQAYLDILGRPANPEEFGVDLTRVETPFALVIQDMLAGKTGVRSLESGGEELIVAFAPLPSTGWSQASVVRAEDVLGAAANLQSEVESGTRTLILNRLLPGSLLVLVLVTLLGIMLTNLITRPVEQLVTAADQIGKGNWDIELPTGRGDELGSFAKAFAAMTSQLRNLVTSLEDMVAQRTAALQRRAAQLQASIEVGHSLAEMRDLDALLSQVSHLISRAFDFYHVGIFLFDERGEFVELRAANSPGGQRMLRRNHRLKVGEQGIVGYVAGAGEPRIALDVGADAVFFNNPDLPNTRSEMALPLVAAGRRLGVLDIQSTQPSAFSQEDIDVLRGVADQIAVAIENARLFSENQAVLEAMRRAYGELSQEAWEELLATELNRGYVASAGRPVTAIGGEWPAHIRQAVQARQPIQPDSQTLALPIHIREKVAGAIRLRKPAPGSPWSQEEIQLVQKLIDQLAVSLESARLYQETRRRAEREKLAGEISARLRQSNDPETILKTALSDLKKALGVTRAQILITPNLPATSPPPGNGHEPGEDETRISRRGHD